MKHDISGDFILVSKLLSFINCAYIINNMIEIIDLSIKSSMSLFSPRHLKQDESTNKDYAYQEKGNNYLGDGFAGGYLKSDSHTSLLQLIDKSPSLTSNGRRHVNRFDVRQCLDAEDPTQRSVGSRDLKDFSGKEGKGSRELHIEAPVGDELSQADGDTLSVSSPFIRGGNFSSTTKSSLPPLVRSGVDSPFGFSEDDSRGKPSNRHRRTSDPSIGRFQGNSWK